MTTIWTPRVTVAAIVEQHGKFLFVEERADDQLVINQPAGHWDQGESLVDAVVREMREETTLDFTPQGIVGLYDLDLPAKSITYLRLCFFGLAQPSKQPLQRDKDIVDVHWLTLADLNAKRQRWRSPLVGRCVNDYLGGARYPLSLASERIVG